MQAAWNATPPADECEPCLLVLTTSALSLNLLRGQLRFFRETGFDVTVACSPDPFLDSIAREERVRAEAIPMSREIDPLRDVISLWRIWRCILRIRPFITSVSTPKAGLLGGLAAWLSRVPCRVYVLRGLRGETSRGARRWFLFFFERLACRMAHRVICVSESLRQKAIGCGVVAPDRAVVLGEGSSNGVDASRFAPTPERLRQASALRTSLGIPRDAAIAGFVGRFTRDKGIEDLLQAFAFLRERFPELRLLLVGEFEKGNAVPADIHKQVFADPQIICTGFVSDPAPYYHVMDILALPSHREGFPNAVLEAHGAGKPVVGARATGILDAVRDGIDGILVPVGDARALAEAIADLLRHPRLAREMGRAGRERVEREFRPQRIWAGLLEEYSRLLHERGLPAPRRTAGASRAVSGGATVTAS
ncbi:MAG TPA: glycosyltransferase family 4 protein [Candidatus Acidoferrales bacterium]|nr:glycosyltransferase family 4 protein [Candidatus Acidoferrales bacterium]